MWSKIYNSVFGEVGSFADSHHLDAHPDPDPTFHFDVDLDLDPSFQIKAQNLEQVLI